jgi:DnaJ-domain-containing protein 1
MPALLIVLLGALVFFWALGRFSRSNPANVARLLRRLGGAALVVLSAFFLLRGEIYVAAPIFATGLGLMGWSMGNFRGFGTSRTPGQSSRITTAMLVMELDHDTGRLAGSVRQGKLAGRSLASLSRDEISALLAECDAAGDQSRAVLEAWIERSHPEWRSTGSNRAAPSHGRMTRAEAFEVLGLPQGATSADIKAAHRRLMKDFHPDRGGSTYLAAMINEAKDVLLA